jgi:hypothetical protein
MSEERGPTLDLESIMAEAMLAEYNSYPKNMKLWASDLGYSLGPDKDGCPLGFWLSCRDEPKRDPTPGEVMLFKAGDLLHDFIAQMLEKWLPLHGWEVVGVETRVAGLHATGRLDVKVRHVSTGITRVIDVKTKRGNAFRYLNEPKDGNRLQVQFYTKHEDADVGDLLYVDREGQNFMRHFEVPRNDDAAQAAEEGIKELRDGPKPEPLKAKLERKKNKGPDSIYLKYPWQVDWCNLKKCPCKKSIGALPEGILAKVANDGKVTPEEGREGLLPMIVKLLQGQYPEETFYV